MSARGRGEHEVTRLQLVIVRATTEATPSLRELARDANISDSTLSTWRRGTRVPPAEAVEVLAAVLLDRSEALADIARQLEQVAGDLWTAEGRERWLSSAENEGAASDHTSSPSDPIGSLKPKDE